MIDRGRVVRLTRGERKLVLDGIELLRQTFAAPEPPADLMLDPGMPWARLCKLRQRQIRRIVLEIQRSEAWKADGVNNE